ncbi:MAG TPA: glycoside hydrolase family 9 protein [Burkholderiaceae bacterium]|nr:glycoside hydrolase family 9 protein [Burkholderiaceae bacterium]
MQRLFSLPLAAVLALAPIVCHAAELLRNPDFQQGGNGWWVVGAPWKVRDGRACVQIDRPGSNPWDVILGQGKVALKQGREYTVSFTAAASEPTWLRPLLQYDAAPWTPYFAQNIPIGRSPQPVRLSFTMRYGDDDKAGFQFQLGGRVAATVCISQVSLDDTLAAAAPPPQAVPEPPPAAVPQPAPPGATLKRVRLNQVGYLPRAPKRATIASNATSPLPWQLRNAGGQVVAEGRTSVFGLNQASGESVHIADFSAVSASGSGYVLSAGTDTSHPFRIGSDVYRKLRIDALSFFQQNRSRAGGWYDARDPGKYTVNGGIALWTLHHLAERALQRRNDGSARDLLNSARWEMDFMLAMQVPDGRQLTVPRGNQSAALNALKLDRIDAGGMVHHKAQDPVSPNAPAASSSSRDTPPQYLHYPSTAATLSLAATAAQCARLWQRIDAPYARRCLEAAERAWDAAVRFPDVYAYNTFAGGGPYDNQDVSDEFYWAAAELFASTGDPYYLESLQESSHYLDAPAAQRNETGALLQSELGVAGTIVLATAPSELPATQVARARERLVAAARAYLAQISREGYLLPYSVDQYPWGSNANIVNRALVLGIAYDITRDPAFFNGAAEAMNYVLGRNPLDQSYVSGYGSRTVQNPHHRFWSRPAGADDGTPPPGMLSGGPNSVSFSDPVATKLRGRCTGQTCWIDDVGAWTVNEVAVNWNASLLWVATFLDEGLR